MYEWIIGNYFGNSLNFLFGIWLLICNLLFFWYEIESIWHWAKVKGFHVYYNRRYREQWDCNQSCKNLSLKLWDKWAKQSQGYLQDPEKNQIFCIRKVK